MSHYLIGKNSCCSFLHTIGLHLFQNNPFPSMLSFYETPMIYRRLFFSTNLMKNSQLLNFQLSRSVWTIRQKRTFEICERFRSKKTYLIINLVAIIMMFFIRPSQDFNPSKKSFLPQPQDDQSQKNFNRVAFPYQKEKNRNFDNNIFGLFFVWKRFGD